MYLPKTAVTFDDVDPFDVQTTSRDLVAMETDGVDLSNLPPIRGTYTMVWYALRRLERTGKLPAGVEVPDTVDGFLDMADINPQDEDPEGNGSGQVATPGSSAP